MNTELHKRLEEAAGEYARQYYQDADFAIVITYDALDKNLKRAVKAGAEHGYKEAIAMAKEWMKGRLPTPDWYASLDEFIAAFEADMNKLLEEKK